MFDSISDSEQSRSHENQESEIEAQLLAESKRVQLQEQNEQLLKENTSLQAQYEQALKLTAQVEEMHQKNRQLSSDLRVSNSDKENLEKRLDIAQKLNEELKQKIDSEKHSSAALHNTDLVQSQKELQKTKQQAKAQIDNVYAQLEQVQTAKDQSDMTIKLMNNKFERILSNASHFFELEFATIDDFINYIGQTPMAPSQAQVSQQQTPRSQSSSCAASTQQGICDNQALANLEKKLKHERLKVKNLSSQKDELESNVARLQREIQDSKARNQQEVTQLNNKIKQIVEDHSLADSDKGHTIQNLQNKVNDLTSKLNHKKKQEQANRAAPAPTTPSANSAVSVPQQQYVQQPPQVVYQQVTPSSQQALRTPRRFSEEDISNCPASEHLVNQNIDLSYKLKSAKERCDDLVEQLKSAENRYIDLEVQYNKQKNDLSAISIVHRDTVAELNMMRKALHEKESVKDRADKKLMRREFQAQKALAQNLSSQVESQKEQLNELSLANQQAIHTIDTQHTTILDLKQEVQVANENVQKLRDELLTTQAELDGKEQVTPEQLIPASAWSCSSFTSELNSAINSIARNPSLQPASKIRNVYKLIAKYYNEIIAVRDSALDNSFNESQSIGIAVNQFLVNLSIALELEPITFNDFFTKHPEQKIIDTITNIRSCHNDLKRKNEQTSQTLARVCSAFNINPDQGDGVGDLAEFEMQVNSLRAQASSLQEQLTKSKKKCRELSSAFKSMKKKTDVEAEDSKNQISQLNEATKVLQKQIEEGNQVNQKMKWEIQNLKTKLQDFQQMHEEQSEEYKEKIDTIEKASALEKAKIENELNEQIRQLSSQCGNSADNIAQYIEQISRLKKSIELQKATIAGKDCEIQRLTQQHEEAIQNTDEKYSSEKKQLITSYENAIAELRQQCEAHRLDVEKIAKVLASTEKKVKQSKETILQLKKDKIKAETEFKNALDQNERQKKLADTATKCTILATQTDYNNKLDEERTKIEEERRRMYGTIADAFKQFTNLHEDLNEKSFKSTIFKARDEISRLTSLDSAVRRIVNADRNQKTDDAVAQVVLMIA